jgi:hypothetical protein
MTLTNGGDYFVGMLGCDIDFQMKDDQHGKLYTLNPSNLS